MSTFALGFKWICEMDYLMKYGFVWSEHQKQFRPIGYDQWLQKTA